jgi:hypothetical protein
MIMAAQIGGQHHRHERLGAVAVIGLRRGREVAIRSLLLCQIARS